MLGKIDWTLQLDHYSGPLSAYQLDWERTVTNPDFKQRFLDALHALLPPEQGRYAVYGRCAMNAYTVPRETQDIDICIAFAGFEAVVAPLERRFDAQYEFKRVAGQVFVHWGFGDPDPRKKVADLTVAEMNPVLLAALRHPKGTRRVHVPRFGEAWTVSPEALVAAKFFSASEVDRSHRRLVDAGDIVEVLKQKELQPLDVDLMRRLVAFVPWVGAAEKFEEILRTVAAGKTPTALWGPDVGGA